MNYRVYKYGTLWVSKRPNGDVISVRDTWYAAMLDVALERRMLWEFLRG